MRLFDNQVKVSLIQMKISAGKKQENLARAVKHIKESSEAGARLVVLPECFSTGINLTSLKKDAESFFVQGRGISVVAVDGENHKRGE